MKKILMFAFALILFLGISKVASADVSIVPNNERPERPTCELGFHYEGELVSEKVCTKPRPWDIRPICYIRLEWVGQCVKNDTIVPPTPVIKPIYTDDLMGVINAQCKDDQIIWSEWSKCDYNFGKQFRFMKRDVYGYSLFNGCHPTGLQQSTWERSCE